MSQQSDKQYNGIASFAKQGENGKYELKPWTYAHKKFADDDLEVKIEASGICGSDLHTIRHGWGDVMYKPGAVVGHEIVGRVTRIGKGVKGFELGQRVGFGAQAGSCLSCDLCKSGWENLCEKEIPTYQGEWEDGSVSQGGYADYYVGKAHFAIPIPDGLSSEVAAPLLCAGITTYSPLKNHGVGPGKKVAIIGVGGLGHLALQWAKALGADVYAVSHQEAKHDDVHELGVTNFINSSDFEKVQEQYASTFDFILCTNDMSKLPLSNFTSLLKPFGTVCIASLPEGDLAFNAFDISGKNKSITGSHIGPPGQIKEMLQFAVDKGVRTWVDVRPLTVESVNKALSDVAENRVRYRVVLVPEGQKA